MVTRLLALVGGVTIILCGYAMAGVIVLKTGSVRGDYETHFIADITQMRQQLGAVPLKLLVFGSATGRPLGDMRPDWWDGVCTMNGRTLERSPEQITGYVVDIPVPEAGADISQKIMCDLNGTIGGHMPNPRIVVAVDKKNQLIPGLQGIQVDGYVQKKGSQPVKYVFRDNQYVADVEQPGEIREFSAEYVDSVVFKRQESPVRVLKTTDTVLCTYSSTLPLQVTRFEHSGVMAAGVTTGCRELWLQPPTDNIVGRRDGCMTINIQSK
ncbi:hypothetical protein ACQGYV_004946 [Escherichia coli]